MARREKKQADFFLLKGILEEVFAALGLSKRVRYEATEQDGLHPGRSAASLLMKNQWVTLVKFILVYKKSLG